MQALLGLSNIVSARPYFTLPLPFSLPEYRNTDNVKKNSDATNNTEKNMKRRIEGERIEEIDMMTKNKNEKEEGGGGGGGNDDAEGSVTAIHVVLQIMKSKHYTAAANCIGLLMNACLETSTDDSTARSTVKASSASPSASTSTSTSAPISSSLSASHPVPLSVREVVTLAGGAALGLTGVRMTAAKRAHFFNFQAPEG